MVAVGLEEIMVGRAAEYMRFFLWVLKWFQKIYQDRNRADK